VVFNLYTSATGGASLGAVTNSNVTVSSGLLTTTIDGNRLIGDFTNPPMPLPSPAWLELAVATNGANVFTTLTPRQQLTSVPYALSALTASNLAGALPVTQLTGTVGNGQLANSSITINTGAGLSGGGTVALGGSINLAAFGTGGSVTNGITSVTGDADITASNMDGAVSLGDNGTSAATPNTLVKRDSAGSLAAADVTVNGVLHLPFPAVMYAGSNVTYIDEGSFFAGGAGNRTLTGVSDVGVGALAQHAVTSGSFNTAVGEQSLQANTTGTNNLALGFLALATSTNGALNTALGFGALSAMSSGYGNIAIGISAGANFTRNEANNIDVGNPGLTGEDNTIRIGTEGTQTSAYVAGIYDAIVGAGSPMVIVDSTGKLGTQSFVASGGLSGSYTNGLTFTSVANSFTGNGGGLTGLNASQLTSGTVPASALSGTYSGAVTFNNSANTFTGNGSGLTSLNSTNLTGTLSLSQLPAAVMTNFQAGVVLSNVTLALLC